MWPGEHVKNVHFWDPSPKILIKWAVKGPNVSFLLPSIKGHSNTNGPPGYTLRSTDLPSLYLASSTMVSSSRQEPFLHCCLSKCNMHALPWKCCKSADSDSLGLGWSLRCCSFKKLPGIVNAAGLWTTLWVTVTRFYISYYAWAGIDLTVLFKELFV